MAASNAMIGYGTRVLLESPTSPTDSPPTYIEMDEILNVTPPNQQIDDVEVTHNSSPLRTKEFIAGLIDPGTAGWEMNFIPGSVSDIALRSAQQAGARLSCQMIFPNFATWTFESIVKGYEVTSATESKMTAKVTLKTAGSVVAT